MSRYDHDLAMDYIRYGVEIQKDEYVQRMMRVLMDNIMLYSDGKADAGFLGAQIQQLVQVTAQMSRLKAEGRDAEEISPPEGEEREKLYESQKAMIEEMSRSKVKFIDAKAAGS